MIFYPPNFGKEDCCDYTVGGKINALYLLQKRAKMNYFLMI